MCLDFLIRIIVHNLLPGSQILSLTLEYKTSNITFMVTQCPEGVPGTWSFSFAWGEDLLGAGFANVCVCQHGAL